jgi:uncharacterized protein YyaL (SSP411 family)
MSDGGPAANIQWPRHEPPRPLDEPYLLQHAHNPVDWHPWGEEALARRGEDKPILLSIGYSRLPLVPRDGARVVRGRRDRRAHERALRAVKVDREERPDLDDIYMAATLAMNQGRAAGR